MTTVQHDEMTCQDVERLLAELAAENERLREKVDHLTRVDAARTQDQLRNASEVESMRTLVCDLRKKTTTLTGNRQGSDEQISMLQVELEAAEAELAEVSQRLLPEGTVTHVAVTQAEIVAAYRRLSGVHRGPVPPAVMAAVTEAMGGITEEMAQVAEVSLDSVLRRAIRRRRTAKTTGKVPISRTAT